MEEEALLMKATPDVEESKHQTVDCRQDTAVWLAHVLSSGYELQNI